MEQLKHEDELRPFSEVALDPCEINEDELELALTIIDQRVNEKFEPERYQDQVRSRMMERIQQKIDGREITLPPEEAPESKIVDLMEALKASVAGSGSTAKKPAAKTAAKKKQPAKKTAAAKKKPAARAKKKPTTGRSRKTG